MKRRVTADGICIEYTLIQTVRAQAQVQTLPGGQVRVYAPRSMKLKQADELVASRAEEIRSAQRKLDREQRGDSGSVMLEGRLCPVYVSCGKACGLIEPDGIHLTLEEPECADAVRAALTDLLTARAQERIMQRLSHYHAQIGGHYGRIAVEELGIKWGACNQAHDLHFNWRLIMAPPEALDYVVIHELCHLHEFSHSPRFWKMVQAQMPAYELWKKWLTVHKEELRI